MTGTPNASMLPLVPTRRVTVCARPGRKTSRPTSSTKTSPCEGNSTVKEFASVVIERSGFSTRSPHVPIAAEERSNSAVRDRPFSETSTLCDEIVVPARTRWTLAPVAKPFPAKLTVTSACPPRSGVTRPMANWLRPHGTVRHDAASWYDPVRASGCCASTAATTSAAASHNSTDCVRPQNRSPVSLRTSIVGERNPWGLDASSSRRSSAARSIVKQSISPDVLRRWLETPSKSGVQPSGLFNFCTCTLKDPAALSPESRTNNVCTPGADTRQSLSVPNVPHV